MENDKNKVSMDDLISEIEIKESRKNALIKRSKNFAKKTASSIFLIPLIKPTFQITKKIITSSLPKQRIESYEEALKRNKYTSDDIKNGYKYHLFLRNLFIILSFLFLLYMIIFVETKLQATILSIGLLNLILFTLKHDLRVWQIENKKLCFFGYYLKERFLQPIINTITKEKR